MPPAELPSHIGRYEVIKRLERGGMGALFLARDPVIDRPLAIKLLRDDLDDDELRERFQREARFAGGLRHPNIVTIFDVGDDDGRPFIAMEYIKGETLRAVIRDRRPVSLGLRLGWIEKLCAGLHYAHRAGVIHRDIKPANLMIDEEGTLKILDFGIARVGTSDMTRTGMVFGTLNYMAPEQMEGRPVDARADLYSVGAVLYELLAYQPAFPGDVGSGLAHRVLSGRFEPLENVCPTLDREVASVVKQCLETDPDKRWPDLDVVRQRLAAIGRRIGRDPQEAHVIDSAAAIDEARVGTSAASHGVRRESERQRLLTIRAGQIQTHLQAARRAFDQGDYAAAVDACRHAMVLDPDQAEAIELEERAHEFVAAADQRQRPLNALRRHQGWAVALLALVVSVVAIDLRWRRVPPPIDEAGAAGERAPGMVESGGPQARANAEEGVNASITGTPRPIGNSAPEKVGDQKAAPAAPVAPPAPGRRASAAAPEDGARGQRAGRPEDAVPEPVADSAQALQLACDRGDAARCFALALSYQNATGVQKDQARAVALFQQSCDNGSGQGCNASGIAYLRGNGVQTDEKRAAALYQRACDAGYAGGCNNLGLMYVRGTSVSKDETRASVLFERGCDLGDGAPCANIGHAYELGLGVPKDEGRAAGLYQRGCASGHAGSCASFGWMYFRGVGIEKNEARAVSLFQRACDAGNPVGCNDLGVAYAQGRGVTKDEKRAAELYQQSCDKGNALACLNIGLRYARGDVVPRDEVRAVTLFQRACDGGNPGGCMQLGSAYSTGRGVSKDESRSVSLYQRACDSGIADACTRAATMFEQGRGVVKDAARAAALYLRGRELLGKSSGDSSPPAAVTPGAADTGRGGPPLAAVSTPAQAPSPPPTPGILRVGGLIKAPAKVKDVRPDYPAAALWARVEGVVIIEITIGTDGAVTQANVLRSIPLLDQAAEDAVKQWRFAPTIVDGKPAPVATTVTVNFSLNNSGGKPDSSPAAGTPR